MISTRLTIVLLLLCCGIEASIAASLPTNSPPGVPDRCLFIVDVSSPMKSRSEAVQESVTSLLMSGLQGQLHQGDELAIWTFNNTIHTGDFNMVRWDDEHRNEIVRGVLQFLKEQHYRERTDFSAVMPHLMDVVRHSKRITVILYSDGDESIAGTPFDKAILTFFEENRDALKDKKVPVVTVLRGYKGRLFAHSISFPPWPVEFPPFPPEPEPEPKPVEPSKPKASAASPGSNPPGLSQTLLTTNKGPIVVAEPLIVSGRKTTEAKPEEAVPREPENQPEAPNPSVATDTPTEPIPAPVPTSEPTNVGASGPKAGSETGRTASGSGRLLGVSFVGALLLVGLLVLWGVFRRPRTRSQRSLITKSMESKRRGR